MDATKFLYGKRSGEARGVFERAEIGEISLVWGDNGVGLQHIIDKHIIKQSDFNSVKEMLDTINDVITQGIIETQGNGDYRIEKDGNRAIIATTEDGKFVLTAYGINRGVGEKKKHCGCDTVRPTHHRGAEWSPCIN